MNVIALNGSPHKNGVVAAGLGYITEELQKEGISTEIIQIGGQEIRGCIDCHQCRKLGRCVFNADPVNECAQKIKAADGLIIGSPVYYGGIAGTFKSFLDRLFFPGLSLKYKPAMAIASLRRSGGVTTFQQLNSYLNLAQAVIVPTVYWSVIHGNTPEEYKEDAEGVCIMQTAGRNMAWLLKTLEAGSKTVAVPEVVPRLWTNFIH